MTDNDDGEGKVLAGQWYADVFDVGYNAFQFKVDCGHDHVVSGDEIMKVYVRIIANPIHARELFRRLGADLLRYADTFGPIAQAPKPPGSKP